MPETTQAAIIHPIGSDGVVVVGTDTQRGFTTLDQASSGGPAGQSMLRMLLHARSALAGRVHALNQLAAVMQAWVATLADKLEVSLEGFVPVGTGFGAKR